jgi:hypothetical protein
MWLAPECLHGLELGADEDDARRLVQASVEYLVNITLLASSSPDS